MSASEDKDHLLARQRDWINDRRGSLMLVATLAACMAYRAGATPPGGFWRDLSEFPLSYARFRACSGMALASSVLIVLLLSNERFYRTSVRMRTLMFMAVFDFGCLVAALAFGSSPGDPFGALAYLILAPVVVWVLAYSGAYVWERCARS